jgi:predicted dehydrogenase
MPDEIEAGIGILGYGSMGRAHASAFLRLPQVFWPPPLQPRLVAVCGRTSDKVKDFAHRFAIPRVYEDWRGILQDPDVTIFDNTGPNALHLEPCVEAAGAGKHLICEKPLAGDAAEAWQMLQAAEGAGVKHTTAFVYRFIPAVRLARQIVNEGTLGRLYHFRARYLQAGHADREAPWRWRHQSALAGSGVLGDLGSHIIDMARFLVGEPASVAGTLATYVTDRPIEGQPDLRGKVDVDDSFAATVTFRNGATGTLEGSKVCWGHWNNLEFEINGELGSLTFNLERLNELELYLEEDRRKGLGGFRRVIANEPGHPFAERWWSRHPLGWDSLFVHQVQHFLAAVAGQGEVAPLAATFADGYRCAEVCDAIARSAASGARVSIEYRDEQGGGTQ